jgi:putative ABC transport system permease protein
MVKISLKDLWARKRRLTSIFLAVFLGVAFLSGTLALGDTISANFNTLFSDVTKGTDAVVRSATSVEGGRARAERGPIDASLVDRVRSVEGVAKAEPYVQGYGALIGKDGKAIGGNGPPRQAANWVSDPDLNPYRLVEGRAPQAPDEVVVNRGAAEKGDLHLGDTAMVQTPEPVQVKIVGIATFGTADGFGSATYTAFTLDAAQQRLLARPGQVSSILVKAAPGVSQHEVVQRVRSALRPGAEAITGAQLTKENTDDINRIFLDFLRTFLVVFAAIALLVATFSIYNTFSIITAQRTREAALMRAVGATRRQVLISVALEALLVGVLASAAGLAGGLAIAGLLKALFDAFGFALPAGGLVLTGSTVVTSLVVGLVVTVLAGAGPALRSSRVRPLAALRDVAVDRTTASGPRALAGLAVTGVGVSVVLAAVIGAGGAVLAWAGLGALLTIVGLVVFGPVVARPASSLLGAPLARLRGVTGSLARGNAMRNPRRTSGTAAALMVGVGVVTLFTVFAGSLKASVDESVSKSFGGDLVISGGRFGGPALSPRLATDVGRLSPVQTAVGLGRGVARLGTSSRQVTIAEPAALDAVLDLDVAAGSVRDLGSRQLAVSKKTADDKGWRVGSVIPVTFLDGTTNDLTVGAVYDSRSIVGDVVLSRAAWAPHAVQDVDSSVLIKLKPGSGLAAGRAAVDRVADAYGAPSVQDRQEYVDSLTQGVNMLLGLVYVMLALAIVIALMGIANTLSLSIHERTRELGLLRAVGQTQAQTRSMVRWESVILSSFGAVGGLGVGVFLGWALVKAAASSQASMVTVFSVPAGQLVVVLVLGALAGVLAGFRPARRAARLNVLEAIATE